MFRAFVPGLRHFCENRREFIGLFGGNCTDYAVIGAKPGPRSAQRFIGPSNHRLGTESFLDGAMSRWFDEPIVAPFHYVLANKKG
jgi:hypothetical protein